MQLNPSHINDFIVDRFNVYFNFQMYIPLSSNCTANSTLALVGEPGDNQNHIYVEDLNLFEILQPVLSHIHLLWELVIISEPIVIMASSPTMCSSMVLALTR